MYFDINQCSQELWSYGQFQIIHPFNEWRLLCGVSSRMVEHLEKCSVVILYRVSQKKRNLRLCVVFGLILRTGAF